ncbi:hypothetical protein DH2020_013718 [Rehmannia glutinosa]|uniref:Microsomal glutathione S-transferase n=1 Tax=Rehmannia glutinosa TaxID=99300 RepID=A0ABR0X6B7_REHGL
MAGVELLPREYGYVVLVLVFYNILNFWMATQVAKPEREGTPEFAGNDARVFMLMILGGIKHPVICASLGAVYTVSRFFYFKGYSTGDPKKRLTIGKYGFVAMLGLMICAISCGVQMLIA